MNKRQIKKIRKREEEFCNFLVDSYKELKAFNKEYHEYAVWQKRVSKKCSGCEHFISDTSCCDRSLMLLPCIKKK